MFNLKQLAKTLAYLNENNIIDYEHLVEKSKQPMKRQQQLDKQIRSINEKLNEKNLATASASPIAYNKSI